MMEVLDNTSIVNILQYKKVSNQQVVYLQLIHGCMSTTSQSWGEKSQQNLLKIKKTLQSNFT